MSALERKALENERGKLRKAYTELVKAGAKDLAQMARIAGRLGTIARLLKG